MKQKGEILIPAPTFPEPLRYVWSWYLQIRAGIQGNGMSYPVITWETLHCWAQLMRQEISPREAGTIISLGNMWAAIMSEKKPDGT